MGLGSYVSSSLNIFSQLIKRWENEVIAIVLSLQYTWEQEEFDAVTRMTRISLHFRLENTKKTIKNAFSYQWRL